jgi:hypothetical protein
MSDPGFFTLVHVDFDRQRAARSQIVLDAGLPADGSQLLQSVALELDALAAQLREAAGRALGLNFDQRRFLAGAGARLAEIRAHLEEATR